MSDIFESLLEAHEKLRKRTYKLINEGAEEDKNLKQVASGQPAKPIDQNAGSTLDQASPGDVVEPDNSENVTDDGDPNQYVVGPQGELQELEDPADAPGEEQLGLEAPNPFPGLEQNEEGKFTIVDPNDYSYANSTMFEKEYDAPLEAYAAALKNLTPDEIFGEDNPLAKYIPEYMNIFQGLSDFMKKDEVDALKDKITDTLQTKGTLDYAALHNKELAREAAINYVAKYMPEEMEGFYRNGNKEFYGSILMDLLMPYHSIGIPGSEFVQFKDIRKVFSTFMANRKALFKDEPDEDFSDPEFASAYQKTVGSFHEDETLGRGFIFRMSGPKQDDLVLLTPDIKKHIEDRPTNRLDFSKSKRKTGITSLGSMADNLEEKLNALSEHPVDFGILAIWAKVSLQLFQDW